MAVRTNLLAFLAFLLLSALVQAQFPWGNGGGGTSGGGGGGDDDSDDSDDSNSNGGRNGGGGWPGNSGGGGWPGNAGGGWPGKGGGGGWPWQQTTRQSPRPTLWPQPTVNTIPRPSQGPPLPTSSTRFPWQPVPTVPTTRPWQPPTPAQSTPHWTAPTAWGPNRTKPFGQTPTGPQTIPTTTTAPPKEPVPFMTNCGRARYVEDDVSNALIAGCYYKNKTRTVNKSEYPRPFQNLYNFNFEPVTGPFFEFPLIASAPYVGGPPGPDRVIFSESCYLAGEITESGAGTRGFVACVETF